MRTRVRILVAAGLAVAAVMLVASQVLGGTYLNTIEPTATLQGRHLHVTIIYGCTKPQKLTLRVTATQRHVGALAEGTEVTSCNQDVQHIPVQLTVHGSNQFIAAANATSDQVVEVCALGLTSNNGHVDDSHQWCKEVTLVNSQ